MSVKDFSITVGNVPACPACGNQQHFRAHSEQVAEDCCDVWVTCRCGHDLTADKFGLRMEDVCGALDRETIADALRVTWIDLVPAQVTAGARNPKKLCHAPRSLRPSLRMQPRNRHPRVHLHPPEGAGEGTLPSVPDRPAQAPQEGEAAVG